MNWLAAIYRKFLATSDWHVTHLDPYSRVVLYLAAVGSSCQCQLQVFNGAPPVCHVCLSRRPPSSLAFGV